MQRSTEAVLGRIMVGYILLFCFRVLLDNFNLLCLLNIAKTAKLWESNMEYSVYTVHQRKRRQNG